MKQASLKQMISEPSWKCGVEADEKEANRSQHAGHAWWTPGVWRWQEWLVIWTTRGLRM